MEGAAGPKLVVVSVEGGWRVLETGDAAAAQPTVGADDRWVPRAPSAGNRNGPRMTGGRDE